MSKEIIIEEDTKTETKEMILDLPEGERGITEEETETKEQQIKNTMLAADGFKAGLDTCISGSCAGITGGWHMNRRTKNCLRERRNTERNGNNQHRTRSVSDSHGRRAG